MPLCKEAVCGVKDSRMAFIHACLIIIKPRYGAVLSTRRISNTARLNSHFSTIPMLRLVLCFTQTQIPLFYQARSLTIMLHRKVAYYSSLMMHLSFLVNSFSSIIPLITLVDAF